MSEHAEVVSVIRHDVRPGHRDAYEAWTRDVIAVATGFEGHRGVTIVRPPEGQSTYTIVLHFDTLDHLRAWLDSDSRTTLLSRAHSYLAGPGNVEIRPGLDFWLPAPGPRRAAPHRQFLLALSVIYPLSLLVPAGLRPLFASVGPLAHPMARALVVSSVIVWLMTYLIMPRYTRLVGHWLYGAR